MKKHLQKTALYVLVFMWIYASASKLIVLRHFTLQLAQLPWIGSYHAILAVTVPASEIMIAIILIAKSRIGAIVSGCMLALFTVYISCVLQYAPSVPCSCGGIISTLSWRQHILFNTIFFLLSIFLLIKDLPFGRRKQGYAENLITE